MIQSHVVASWGLNAYGELGDGTAATRWQPGDIQVGNDAVQVAGGTVHVLAVRSDGTVWAWGLNEDGELGDGTTTDRNTPVQVAGLTGITQVAAANEFSLALRSDGTVWAWGKNSHGQLGRKTVTGYEATPARVAVLNGVTKISAGRDFALALRSDGIVFAWGRGDRGQLGNGGTADSAVPVKIAGLAAVTGIPASIAGISAGGGFAVVLGADGSVWDWGINEFGELGVAPEDTFVTRPVNAIAAGSGITQLSAGYAHVLALKSDGTVLAWGYNQSGQLGRDITAWPGPAPVAGLASVTEVSGGWQSSYAVHTVPFLIGR